MVYLLIIFCFVLFPFVFFSPSLQQEISLRAPFVCAAKSKKKSPLRWRQCQRRHSFFLKKESGECIGPPSTRHTRLVFCWIFSFPNRPRYARVTMACFCSPLPPTRWMLLETGPLLKNPRCTRRPVGGGQCVSFFLPQGHLL